MNDRDNNEQNVRAVSAAATASRFPPPWSVEELDACFVVRDQGCAPS
jgi:hypothetical protein